MSNAKTTRSTHDLNDVTKLEISGWPGTHRVEVHSAAGVEIEAPVRTEGEFWTFSAVKKGSLSCHTSLLGSPGLLTANDSATGRPWPPMVIRVPEKRIKDLSITFK